MLGLVLSEYGAYANLSSGDWPEPELVDDAVVVSVRATAVNFADALLVSGRYHSRPALPFIPGKCPAGVIEQVGGGVKGFDVGDRVLTLAEAGGFAERVAVKATDCFRLPDRMSFADAASLSSIFDTAWIALYHRGAFKAGETLLVLGGSSGVGLAAAQLAKSNGGRVISTVENPDKAEIVRSTGAEVVMVTQAEGSRLRDEVLKITDGKGADVVIDLVGGDVFGNALRAVAWEGRVVIVGFASGIIPQIQTNYLLLKNISLSGMQISHYRRNFPDLIARCWDDIFSRYEVGRVRPVPTVTWPLSRTPEALNAIATRHATSRIVLIQQPSGERT